MRLFLEISGAVLWFNILLVGAARAYDAWRWRRTRKRAIDQFTKPRTATGRVVSKGERPPLVLPDD